MDAIFSVAVFVLGLGFFLFTFWKKGLRGFLYGSPAKTTVGEIEIETRGTNRGEKVRVYVLENGRYAVEYAAPGTTNGFVLDDEQATELIHLLQQAQSSSESSG